jgi:hypothetical protein
MGAGETEGRSNLCLFWVTLPTCRSHYYFATGGCHRWEAHKRLGRKTIPARLIKVRYMGVQHMQGMFGNHPEWHAGAATRIPFTLTHASRWLEDIVGSRKFDWALLLVPCCPMHLLPRDHQHP